MIDKSAVYQINTDGGARGNPGKAAVAYVVIDSKGKEVLKEGKYIGLATNNFAEYTGLLLALERAHGIGIRKILVHMDSELIIKQLNGEYRVKDDKLKSLYNEAKSLLTKFHSYALVHVPRGLNKEADKLVNIALDQEA